MRLADSCRPILRGEQPLFLRRDVESKSKPVARETRRTAVHFATAADEKLWQDLRALRKRLSESQDVPPYIILHDSVLTEIVQRRPQNLVQLGRISGIGERKLNLYGDDFLEVIRQHP